MTNDDARAFLTQLRNALDVVLGAPLPAPAPAPTAQPPAPQPPASATTYPVSALTNDDKMFLYLMVNPYRLALANLPGSHQVHFDMLTDDAGRLYSDAAPQLPGTVNDPNLDANINRAINDTAYGLPVYAFDVGSYTGPLRAIYNNLVAAKLAHIR